MFFAPADRNADLQRELLIIENSDTQRAVIWQDGRALYIIGTGRYAFRSTTARIEAVVFDIQTIRFARRKLQAILQLADATKSLDGSKIQKPERMISFWFLTLKTSVKSHSSS